MAPPVAAAPSAEAEGQPVLEGLRVESHSIYTLDPAAHAVHVHIDLTLTNQQPDVRQGGSLLQSYLSDFSEPVPAETSNISATRDDGRTLDVSTAPGPDPIFESADIHLAPALFFPSSVSLAMTYDLPAQPPRSPELTRVNDAFATFVAFGFGDPGITSVKVVVPINLDVDVAGVDMQRNTDNDDTVLSADAIDDPTTWTAGISARDDSRLAKRDASVGDQHIAVLGWPDDEAWSSFVTDEVQKGLPELEKMIGQPWPQGTHDLQIVETVTPYLYGYSGWYEPFDGKIEIGDDLDKHVVLHELSHVWLNKTLFDDRWINEAFADEFAARTEEQMGEPLPAPTAVSPDSAGAIDLEDWGSPQLPDESSAEQEEFGYNASWSLLRAISNEVGMGRLRDVVDAAAHHTITYRGNPQAEVTATSVGWKQLLDLFDEVAGSTQADELFRVSVVAASDQTLLADRQATRREYLTLVNQGSGWSAPFAVRSQMADWDFGAARTSMDTARGVLDTRAQIVDILRPLHIGAPAGLQHQYETAKDLSSVAHAADVDLQAARDIVRADKAVHGGHGPIGMIGMRFDGAQDQLRAAKDALGRGDGEAAIAAAGRARQGADDSTKSGVEVLLVLVLVAGIIAGALIWGRPAVARRMHERRVAHQSNLENDEHDEHPSDSERGAETDDDERSEPR